MTGEERREAKRQYDRELRELRKRLGLCQRCDQKATPGMVLCAPCRERSRQQTIAWRRRMVEQRTCVQCGEPHTRSTVRCDACAKRHVADSKIARYRYREAGRCGECGKPAAAGQYRCPACQERHATKTLADYYRRREQRSSCEHRWRVSWQAEEGLYAGRVRVVWRQWCPDCRKTERHIILADVARLAEVMSWAAG